MPWPIPTPAALAARAAGVYAASFPDFDPTAANTVAATHCRVAAMAAYDLYLHQGYIAQELYPDTSQDSLDRHAAIWGVTRIPAASATGAATAAGAAGTVIPSGTVASDAFGNTYFTTAGATVGGGGSATLAVRASLAGVAGNLATGTVLTLLSPVAGLNPQSITITAPGLTGGAAAESNDALRARLLARIRQRGRGGNVADYEEWAAAASTSVAYVQAIPNWVGLGSVGLFVAGVGPSALSGAQVAVVDAYVQGVRPVTARVVTASATTLPVNATIRLIPDTAANRAAAASGFASWVVTSAEIGGTLFLDGMVAAIKSALGGGDFDVVSPAADIVCAAGVIAAPGALSFA